MEEKNRYYVVTKKAVPEVLLKVVEAKRLLESAKASTVQEAADMVGISRSSFYKYKDDIFPFHDNAKGKTITFMIQMDDVVFGHEDTETSEVDELEDELSLAGLDATELEYMDADERREALWDAGLDPDDYDFD